MRRCLINIPPNVHEGVRTALVERLARFDAVVEVGVGERPAVAAALADRGVDVTATDVRERSVPEAVAFVRDDVTAPDHAVYAGADVLFARNCPPELHRPVLDLARAHDAAFWFTTLGGDPAAVPVERESLPEGETLFVAREGGPGRGGPG